VEFEEKNEKKRQITSEGILLQMDQRQKELAVSSQINDSPCLPITLATKTGKVIKTVCVDTSTTFGELIENVKPLISPNQLQNKYICLQSGIDPKSIEFLPEKKVIGNTLIVNFTLYIHLQETIGEF